MSDTKELIARFRKLAIFDPDFDRAANLIEQQAKELSEAQRKWIAEIERRQALERELEAAQARVVVLEQDLDHATNGRYGQWEIDRAKIMAQALASTDTAAQTLRQADQQAQPQAIPTKQMLWAGTEAFREIVNGAEVDNPALHIFERMIAASQKENNHG